MATLYVSQHAKKNAFKLTKNLTSIGRDPKADIYIDNSAVPPIAAHIHRVENRYSVTIIWPSLRINNTKATKHLLEEGDVMEIGDHKLLFSLRDQDKASEIHQSPKELDAYRRLLDFSYKLAHEKNIKLILESLIDEIILLTHAEKAFLFLQDHGQIQLEVARHMTGKELIGKDGDISDSIIDKVLKTKEAIVLSNAQAESEFKSSVSILNYKLSSIMCAPLLYRQELLGVIYVGNNSFINAFDENALHTLQIFASQASLLVKQALHINILEEESTKLKEKLEYTQFGSIIGACSSMQDVFSQVDKVAQTDISVIISGETGTGKELIAHELHRRSDRNKMPFIAVNCGAIPEHLLESELFGHVRGAFTGAFQSRIGKFQAAHRGTLFLDEISEMPLHLQVKILRALQENQVTRVGDTKTEEVDLRVLCASNRNLLQMVKEGVFREDLFYRLNIVQIHLPPLRERGNDVLLLSNYFLQKHSNFYGKKLLGFSIKAQNVLLNFNWPGNIRQLENRIKRAIVMCEDNTIHAKDLDLDAECISSVLSLSDALERFRKRYIQESLERNAGNRTKAARELGVDPRTIFRHLEEMRGGEQHA